MKHKPLHHVSLPFYKGYFCGQCGKVLCKMLQFFAVTLCVRPRASSDLIGVLRYYSDVLEQRHTATPAKKWRKGRKDE